jgi:uncharacterized lipoprotein YmbA
MNMIGRRVLLSGLPLAWLAACASPNPALFTLAAVPGQALPGGARLVELRQIGLPEYLDRPGIVRSAQNYQLQLAQNDRWAAPLGGMLTRVLVEDLSQRLPGSIVYSVTGAISASPERIVEVDVQRFDADPSGEVVLAAQVAVRSPQGKPHVAARSVRISVRPRSPATADFAAALSAALGQLADAIAEMLRASPA